MKRDKIWLLLDSSESGGIESHVLQLATGLNKHGVPVEVIFLNHYGQHPMRDCLTKLDILTRSLDGRFSTLSRILKNEHPMVVHTHGYKAGIMGRIAAKFNKIPIVSTYHAGEIASGKLALYDWLDRFSAPLCNKIFSVSPQIAQRLPSRSAVFNNFVDSDNLPQSTGKQIAFVGRVSEEKGPDTFMAIANQLPQLDFHLYGDGPLMSAILVDCPTNLTLHGQQDNMETVWPNIGLLVIPSRFEGLPMAALEAMARGIPVIAFNVGALEKLIEPKINGWLIKAGETELLAEQINKWCHLNHQQKAALNSACKETIEKEFCSRRAIPALIKNYRQALN